MSFTRILPIGAAMAMLAACSSVPVAQRQAAYQSAAGAPVTSFRFFAPLWSWEPLGTDQLVVYTRPKEAWLLDVPGCTELPFANAIGLTSNLDQVSVHFDKVLTGRSFIPCAIQQIRPVDMARFKSTQQAQRQVTTQPRPPGS